MMIARVWRATATADGADAYERHFTQAVLPALQGVDGHLGAYLLRGEGEDGRVDLEVMTLWRSLEAVRAFAGAEPAVAVVEPEAAAVLLSFDTTVTHRTVAVETVQSNGSAQAPRA
jgi:heme-degrading monooxygenase HmoA